MVVLVIRVGGGVRGIGFPGLRDQVLEGQLSLGLGPRPPVEEQLRVDPAVVGGHHRRAGAERAQLGLDPGEGGRLHPVGLVQHHQVRDGQVAVGLRVPGPGRVELRGVHDLHQPAVPDGRVLAGHQHPDHLLGLGQPARLDDDHVDPMDGRGQLLQVRVQLAAVDGAAQAAAAERDHRVADLARDGHRIDLDRAEVVDDDADPGASPVAEEVVEQRRLAGSEESGKHDDGNRLGGLTAVHTTDRSQPSAGTGSGGFGPTYRAAGRMIFESAACSRMFALQPITRAAQKVGVNISRGSPHSSMTTPA